MLIIYIYIYIILFFGTIPSMVQKPLVITNDWFQVLVENSNKVEHLFFMSNLNLNIIVFCISNNRLNNHIFTFVQCFLHSKMCMYININYDLDTNYVLVAEYLNNLVSFVLQYNRKE